MHPVNRRLVKIFLNKLNSVHKLSFVGIGAQHHAVNISKLFADVTTVCIVSRPYIVIDRGGAPKAPR